MKIKTKHITAALLLAALLAAPVRPVLAGDSQQQVSIPVPSAGLKVNYITRSYTITIPARIDFGNMYWTGNGVDDGTKNVQPVHWTEAAIILGEVSPPDRKSLYSVNVTVEARDPKPTQDKAGEFWLKNETEQTPLRYRIYLEGEAGKPGLEVISGGSFGLNTNPENTEVTQKIMLGAYEPARGRELGQYKGTLVFSSELVRRNPSTP
ncbi:hypothetical protein [Eubacterium sp. 1001713B170207_170306_E7]|uniref:hypothetical protein n=1 Tax=Eubacterium sp. 1001713B170207_170306_E7 TaxID=2787097 RepID=UPI001897F25F|nr:hypothetical protein [Eubacterium sp. 1001713B170207_170306_E7]